MIFDKKGKKIFISYRDVINAPLKILCVLAVLFLPYIIFMFISLKFKLIMAKGDIRDIYFTIISFLGAIFMLIAGCGLKKYFSARFKGVLLSCGILFALYVFYDVKIFNINSITVALFPLVNAVMFTLGCKK